MSLTQSSVLGLCLIESITTKLLFESGKNKTLIG